jgi:hypothetical protein
MTPVSVGQVWRVLVSAMGPTGQFRVDFIENGCAVGVLLGSGKPANYRVGALASHRRGARLLIQADGSAAVDATQAPKRVHVEKDEPRARRVQPPRGLTTEERRAWLAGC